jgi:protein TonB
MASYVAADRNDRWKAVLAVVAVHVLLALVIIGGLNVRLVKDAVEHLQTFDIAPPEPPPPVPPPSQPHDAAKKPEGAAAKKAEPSPVVAPPTPLPVQSPLPAAQVAGTGNTSTSGAAASGSGSGAGGSGSGSGSGDYSKFTPARLVRNLSRGDYRQLAAGRMPSGQAMVSLRVDASGVPGNCRVTRSSGDGRADALMCQLTLRYIRFDPARDPAGRPVAQDVTFFPNWWRP